MSEQNPNRESQQEYFGVSNRHPYPPAAINMRHGRALGFPDNEPPTLDHRKEMTVTFLELAVAYSKGRRFVAFPNVGAPYVFVTTEGAAWKIVKEAGGGSVETIASYSANHLADYATETFTHPEAEVIHKLVVAAKATIPPPAKTE